MRSPLPLDHQAGRDRLDAAGGQALGDLAPQHRRDLVAVDAVQDAAGLLGVDQVVVDLSEVLEAALDGLAGDLGKGDAVDGDGGLEDLEQVPGDGLALAIAIRGEVQGVGLLEQPLELRDLLLLVRVHHVVRLEVVLDVHRELAHRGLLELGRQLLGLGQVPDVAHRGLDDVGVAEVAADGLDLRRRLHDQ
jgi:hypothetical protein